MSYSNTAKHDHDHDDGHHHHSWKRDLIMSLVCLGFTIPGFIARHVLPDERWWIPQALFAVAYLFGGWHPAHEVFHLMRKRVLDIHFLMIAVAVGAALIGHWGEGAILLFLFSLSGALEALAQERTEREIRSLFRDAPKEATKLDDGGKETKVPAEDLVPDDIVRVRPGEQFPVDGRIFRGNTAVNEANLTGESLPIEKVPGDPVYSGTLNEWGSVDCRVTSPLSESALAKIIDLIREAQESKAPSQRLTDRFGTPYTYFILSFCTVMFFVWWLVLGIPPFSNPEGSSAFYRAMTLLVVASPCALVLSIPSAILAGIAASAREGVLFRGGSAVENLAEVGRVALDKTGTLTTGSLRVVLVESSPLGREDRVLEVAAALGHHSTHPVSRAISSYYSSQGKELPDVDKFRSLSGLGVEGTVNGRHADESAKMGHRGLFDGAGWVNDLALPESGCTETLVECGGVRGRIILEDELRPVSADLIRKLQSYGLKVSMLTGDRRESAQHVARSLGLDDIDVLHELNPEDKVNTIRAWSEKGEKVAMVGDGVNDAPSLAAAYVSVGMGLRGSDAVLEQADVVLMKDKLENVVYAYEMSRRARSIIRQNLAISFGVITILALSALGSFIPLTIGVLGHEGSTVIVVLNSLRLLAKQPDA